MHPTRRTRCSISQCTAAINTARTQLISALRTATAPQRQHTPKAITLCRKGKAFGPDKDGHYSYPIADHEDVSNAVHAVGRGSADHDKIRKYIIGRAKAIGASHLIPDN